MSQTHKNIIRGCTQTRYSTLENVGDNNEDNPFLCRACLSGSNLRPLTKRIAKVFSEFTTTADIFGDEYPQYLCSICLALLKKLIHFQTRCKRSKQVMEKLKLWGRLSVKTVKNLKETNYRYELTLTAIENTSYKPELNRVFTKTLCIEIPSGKNSQKTDHNVSNNDTVVPQNRHDPTTQDLAKYDLSPDLNEAFTQPGFLADRLHQVLPPLYNKVENKREKIKLTKAQKKQQYLRNRQKEKLKEMKKQKEMQRKTEIERKRKFNKRKTPLDRDDSDTLTALSNCDEPDEQDTSRINLLNTDHIYAKPPPVFRSQRLNEKLKSNKLNRTNDEFVYGNIRKKHSKKKNYLRKKNSMTYKRYKEQMMAAIVQIPDENLALNNDMDEETKPDIDGILLDYLNGKSYENNDSNEDLKPDIEDLFIKN